jgi:hypothetical protein
MPDPAPPTTVTSQDMDAYLKPSEAASDAVLDKPLTALAAEADAPAAKAPVPTAPPTVTEPAKPKHPSRLVEMARALRVPEAEIAESATDDLWTQVLHLRDLEGSRPGTEAAKPKPAQQPDPAAEAELKLAWGDDADALIDPDVRGVIEKSLAPVLAELKRLKGLEAEFGGVKQHLQRRAAEEHENGIDRAFAALGDEYAPVFGKGARTAFAAESPEWQRRIAAVTMARGMKGDFATNLASVAKTLFGGTTAAPTTPPAAPTRQRDPATGQFVPAPDPVAEEWAASHLSHPTNRVSPPEPKGARRAANAIANLVAAGRSVNGDVDLDAFPD